MNRAQEPPMPLEGDAARYDHRLEDDYDQVRVMFTKVFDEGQRQRLFMNITSTWQTVPDVIVERQLALFKKIHPDYEAGCRLQWQLTKNTYVPNAVPATLETPQVVDPAKAHTNARSSPSLSG
jgi:catalase